MLELKVDDEAVTLSSDTETIVSYNTLTFFTERTQYPSFADSVKHFTIGLDHGPYAGKLLAFNCSKEELKAIIDMRDFVYCTADPGLYRQVWRGAVFSLVVGIFAFALVLVGIVACFFAKAPAVLIKGLFFAALFGIASLSVAFVKFRQTGNMKRLAKLE